MELGVGLIDGSLKRPRIDLEQDVAALDGGALAVILAHEVPADAGADLRVDVPDQRAHPFRRDRHVLLDHRLDPDRGWRRPGGSGPVATAGGESREDDDQQVCPRTARNAHSEGEQRIRLR